MEGVERGWREERLVLMRIHHLRSWITALPLLQAMYLLLEPSASCLKSKGNVC